MFVCGIVGCLLRDGEVAPKILEALRRLEYRGYDSVGQATLSGSRIQLKKDRGKIDEVNRLLQLGKMDGKAGIGHTRWATHGAPSLENAHPHTDCKEGVAVVHNGIIENFMELKKELEDRGHHFRSRTDTEVIPHLIEDFLSQGEKFPEAVRMTLKKLKGSYAVVAIATAEPDKVVCGRRESPLILGISKDGLYCASDIPAFLPYTAKALTLEEGEMAVLKTQGVDVFDIETAEKVEREVLEISWSAETAQKMGYDHFMLKEIHEQPFAVRNALRTQKIYHELMANMLDDAEQTYLVACGTSYHACLSASYAFAKHARLPSLPVIASEFSESLGHVVKPGTIVLGVSQSGETADTLNALREAKEKGASIISVTNVMGSTITRLSDIYIGQNSGPEIGVAATKTFTAQVAVLLLLALTLAQRRGTLVREQLQGLERGLAEVPSMMEYVIEAKSREVQYLAEKYRERRSFCFLARGVNVATAMEARLKLLELSYIPSLAYPAGESKHGSIAVIEPGFPVVFIAPKDETHDKIIGNMMEMKARGADIIAVIEEGDSEAKAIADDYIEMPSGLPSLLTPLVYVVPLQLFAYYMAVGRGCDPDKPRNLAKSVTVE